MQKIRVGNDVLQFPDDMDDNAITSIIQKEYGGQSAPQPMQAETLSAPAPMRQMSQEQPSDVIVPAGSYEYPTPEQMAQQRQNRGITKDNNFKREVYSTPVLGGIYGAGQDLSNGINGLLARGFDLVTGGNENSKRQDLITRNEQDVYDESNKGGVLDANIYGVNLNDAVVGATGTLFGGGATKAKQAVQAGAKLLPRVIAGAKDIGINAGLGAVTTPVLQERGQEGNQGEFAKQKAIQAGVGIGGGVLGKGAGKLISKVDDKIIPLAKRAKEFGIKLRVDQIKPTNFRKTCKN